MGALDRYLAILADHPFAVVFVSSVIDAVGIPFPVRIILILTPAFLATDRALVGLIAVATLGALLGDHAPYLAARYSGSRMLALYCRLSLGSEDCIEKTLRYFARFGSWALLASRFSTGIRLFAAACVGCRNVSYPRYLLLDAVGTVVYVTTWVLVGHFVGERAVVFLTTDRRRYLFLALVVTSFVLVLGFRLWRRWRHGAARVEPLVVILPPPR